MPKMSVGKITVGTRHRKAFGDPRRPRRQHRRHRPDPPAGRQHGDELIVGERRLRAVRLLGWADVPVVVAAHLVDVAAALRAERDENTCRLDFAPSEAAAMAAALEPFERAEAEKRMKAGVEPPVNFTGGGQARDKIAAAVGLSPPTLAKAAAVVAAAAAHPDAYGDLAADMDATGKVTPA